MKVRYKLTMYGDLAEATHWDPERAYSVQESSVEFCCESMRDLWVKAVTLGDIHYSSEHIDTVGIYDCEPYMSDSPEFHPISFCPFCGSEINREVEERFSLRKHETTETVTRTQYKPEKVETMEEVAATDL